MNDQDREGTEGERSARETTRVPKRPTAVTVIGWYWRVGGILGMVASLPLALWGEDFFGELSWNPYLGIPRTILFLWVFLASVISLLCGNGILKGRNWARVLTLVLCVAGTLIPLIVYPQHPLFWFHLVSNLAFIAMMWFFLFRPKSRPYFSGKELLDA
jgi:hypothetical protein